MKSKYYITAMSVVLCGVFLLNGCGESQKLDKPQDKVVKKTPQQAGTERVPERKIPEDAPRIKVENPVVNLGEVAPNTKNDCHFIFTNAGKGLLTLKEIEKTCGCQQVKIKDNKMQYEPGESGEIIVTYSSSSFPGPVTKHLYIVSDDPVSPRAEITIQAHIEVKVAVEPARMQLFVTRENAGAVPLKVTSKDGKPFAIKRISTPGNEIEFDYDPEKEAAEFTLVPKVDVEKLKKKLSVTIRIELTHPECKSLTVGCYAEPCLSVESQRINMLNAQPGQTTTRDVIIRNLCNEQLEIKSVSTLKGCLEVIEQREYVNSVKLNVKGTVPPRKADDPRTITDMMTVLFTNGDKAEITLSIFYGVR